jgi:ubiquinone biosynthesis protein
MALSLHPEHLKRYKDIAALLIKYGRSDLVREMGGDLDVAASNHEEDPPEARQLAEDLERLGPTFVKIGQLLSTRSDLLPPAYTEALTHLQDDLEPFPYEQVEEIFFAEIGVRIKKAFISFDATPMAAASLGQVHLARLHDGRQVAVKIQRPGVREIILRDLDLLDEIVGFIDNHTRVGRRYGFARVAQELRHTLLEELDYRQEANNLATLKKNLDEFKLIVVPAPVPSYSERRVLTMEYVRGLKITTLSPVVTLEVDGVALSEEIFAAFLKQIVIDGVVHADPHPGNVYLTDDHRIAFFDLGMVIRIPSNMQEQLVRLLMAISEGHGDEAADITIRICTKTDESNRDNMTSAISRLIVENKDATLEQLRVGRLMLTMAHIAAENGYQVPSQMTMVGKALTNLDEVGRTLDPNFNPNAAIRRNSMRLLRKQARKEFSLPMMMHNAIETNRLIQRLPGKLNDLIDTISKNEFRIHVDAIDETRLVQGFQKVANRITMGLILAALIVGAALLMRVSTDFTLFGYPGLAIICFIGAATGGVVLLINILMRDETDRKR